MLKKILFLEVTLCLSLFGFAASVDTTVIHSKSMNKDLKCVIIKPDTYNTKDQRFPVIYLLHGYEDSYEYWIKQIPAIINYSDKYQVIIVCPDGGRDSWYFDSPTDPSVKMETYIGSEVVNYIDSSLRTKADKAHRAITGMSMGGHGALFLALRSPNIFGAGGSSSGVVNLVPFRQNPGLMRHLGDTSNKAPYQEYSILNIIDNITPGSIAIIMDCGTEDPFIRMNKRMHEKMLRLNFPHEYLEQAGGHTPEYWRSIIERHFIFFQDFFSKNK